MREIIAQRYFYDQIISRHRQLIHIFCGQTCGQGVGLPVDGGIWPVFCNIQADRAKYNYLNF